MNRFVFSAVLSATAFAVPALPASAYTGYTTATANLRAGPAVDYPRIVTLRAGTPLVIYGCIDDWSWCDVQWRDQRGWMSAGLMAYEDAGRRLYLPDYGASVGVPLLTFSLDMYWSNYYRNRSWYRERDHWRHHPPHVTRPPDAHPAPRPPRPPAPGIPARPPAYTGNRPPANHVPYGRPPQQHDSHERPPLRPPTAQPNRPPQTRIDAGRSQVRPIPPPRPAQPKPSRPPQAQPARAPVPSHAPQARPEPAAKPERTPPRAKDDNDHKRQQKQ